MSSAREVKKLSFTCDTCRRRKVKCSGEHPTCKRCAARGDRCMYSLNPTLSYTARLEQRIRELEAQQGVPGSHQTQFQSSPAYETVSPVSSTKELSDDQARTTLPPLRNPPEAKGSGQSFEGLKVDNSGGITYHGMTSFFQLPSDRSPASAKDGMPLSVQAGKRREKLVANAWRQRELENLSEIPEPFQYLLNLHWCWIQPLFNFIYRPAFTRDILTLGPYYSHTLMNALLSHSIRWGRSNPAVKAKLDEVYEGGAVFGKYARSMVLDELTSGFSYIPNTCSIPNVQALLLLSAQECSVGNSAQAWIYSGLAFRIIDHLGICVDGERYRSSVQLSDEDVEIRHRLFWSCYFWDKMISLYLGRLPTVKHSSVSPPQIMLDDSAENENWVPFGIDQQPGREYPPTPAHSTSCFMQMCRLSLTFNEILVHMYDPIKTNTQAEMEDCLDKQGLALRQWWDQAPPSLKIDTSNPPAFAPPSHIVTLNALFHTFKILLYRPMLTQKPDINGGNLQPKQNYLVECVSSATSIISIFDLFCRTFGIAQSVLSLSYSVYIATSIFILQVQSSIDDGTALRRLEYSVRMLVQVQKVNPVITSALSLISRQLMSSGISLNIPELPDTNAVPLPVDNGVTPSQPVNLSSFENIAPEALYSPELFQYPFFATAETGDFPFDPELFENMSSIEPLSVRVGNMPEF